MSFRVAFYFYGQIRCTKACIEYFVKNVLQTCPYEYDVFISTWKNNLQQENIDFLNEKLKPKIFELSDIEKKTEEYSKYIEDIKNAANPIEIFYITYLMLKNYENIIKYQETNNVNYTHMFQVRTDVLFFNNFPWNNIDFNSDILYVKNPVHPDRVDDEFTFSTKKNMELYVKYFNYIPIFNVEVFCKMFNTNTPPLILYLLLNKVDIVRLNLDYWLVRCFELNDNYYYDLQHRDYVYDLPNFPNKELIEQLNRDNFAEWRIGYYLYNRNFDGKDARSYP